MSSSTSVKTEAAEKFARFVEVIEALRDPETGCPWDIEQTHESIRCHLVEECYEVLEAIAEGSDTELCLELGDLLLQVALHSQIAKDRKAFDISQVVEGITEKMIRRHPHVFGDLQVENSGEVLRNWETIKQSEGKNKSGTPRSVIAGVPQAMPALYRAQRLGQKAAKVSFDWQKLAGVWEKVLEEKKELENEINLLDPLEKPGDEKPDQIPESNRKALEHELGDLLFSICQLARWLGISAEDSLQAASKRFTRRFQQMETDETSPLQSLSPEELEKAWQKAKNMNSDL